MIGMAGSRTRVGRDIELADLLLATERLPRFESIFLTTLHTLIRPRGARPNMALTGDQLAESAIWLVASLTLESGIIVVGRMEESHGS